MESELARGLDQIARGEYFEAHETLEDVWRAADPAEKDFFQGLVHVAVAWYQAGRGNRHGCERQLEKAARRLRPFAPEHREVPVELVLRSVEDARRTVSAGSLELPTPLSDDATEPHQPRLKRQRGGGQRDDEQDQELEPADAEPDEGSDEKAGDGDECQRSTYPAHGPED